MDEAAPLGKRVAPGARLPHGEAADEPPKKVRGKGKKGLHAASTLMTAAVASSVGSGAELLVATGPGMSPADFLRLGRSSGGSPAPSVQSSSAPASASAPGMVDPTDDIVEKSLLAALDEEKKTKQPMIHWKYPRTWKIFLNIVDTVKPVGQASWAHVATLFRAAVAKWNKNVGEKEGYITCGAVTASSRRIFSSSPIDFTTPAASAAEAAAAAGVGGAQRGRQARHAVREPRGHTLDSLMSV
ncbi:hypothetical protein T484DRAFT_2982527 [Baffinella frigidus]|nr:hypothetical protein T484DRAFT_2982527 [Cryptophyta sp. CCMP2293]